MARARAERVGELGHGDVNLRQVDRISLHDRLNSGQETQPWGRQRGSGGSTRSPDSLRNQFAEGGERTPETGRALRRAFGIPGSAGERYDPTRILWAYLPAAAGPRHHRLAGRALSGASTCLDQAMLGVVQIVRAVRQTSFGDSELAGEALCVRKHPALHGSDRHPQEHPWRESVPGEQAPDQRRCARRVMVQVTQNQPVDGSARSIHLGNPRIEPGLASGCAGRPGIEACETDHPLCDRYVRLAFDGEVDGRHTRASRSGRSRTAGGSVFGARMSARLMPESSNSWMSGREPAANASVPSGAGRRSTTSSLPSP